MSSIVITKIPRHIRKETWLETYYWKHVNRKQSYITRLLIKLFHKYG